MAERIFTTYQVANLLGATPGAVVEWMQKDWLEYQNLPNGGARIPESSLVKFLSQRGVDIGEIFKSTVPEDQQTEILKEVSARKYKTVASSGPETFTFHTDPEERSIVEIAAEMARETLREPTGEPAPAQAAFDEPAVAAEKQPIDVKPVELGQVTDAERDALCLPEITEAEEGEYLAEECEPWDDDERTLGECEPAEEFDEVPHEEFEFEPAHAEEPQQESSYEQPQEPLEEEPTFATTDSSPQDADHENKFAQCAAQIMEAIFKDASSCGAEAIHLTPFANGMDLKYRVCGVMQNKPNFAKRLPDGIGDLMVADVMRRSQLAESAGDIPVTGEFEVEIAGRQVVLELSVMSTLHGRRAVIAIPDRSNAPAMESLGLWEGDIERLQQLLAGDGGLIVVTGDKATGRSQVLHALFVGALAPGRSAATVEKSPKVRLDDVAQSLAAGRDGCTYATAIEALAREDTDVILAGELRDPLAAAAAFDAAHDGALVLAGMKAHSALEALGELLAMGLEPWPLSRSLLAVVEQASFRTLCEDCKKPIDPAAQVLASAGVEPCQAETGFEANGCNHCGHTGYAGQLNIAGVLYMEESTAAQVRNGNVPSGRRPLLAAALSHVRSGRVSAEEVNRVL